MTSATENLTSLEVEILRELNCRTSEMHVAVLVEDYGAEAKEALKSLAKKGLVDLIENGGILGRYARECEMSEEQYIRDSIKGLGRQLFVKVELHQEQDFDF